MVMVRRLFGPTIAYPQGSRTFEDSHFLPLIFQDQFDFNAFELVHNLNEERNICRQNLSRSGITAKVLHFAKINFCERLVSKNFAEMNFPGRLILKNFPNIDLFVASFQDVEIKKKKINFYVIALLFCLYYSFNNAENYNFYFYNIINVYNVHSRNGSFANYEKQFLL